MQFLHDSYNIAPLVRSAPPSGGARTCSREHDSDEGRAAPRNGASPAFVASSFIRPDERIGLFGGSNKSKAMGGGDEHEVDSSSNKCAAQQQESLFFQSWDLLTLIEERRWPELRKFIRRRDASRRLSAIVSSLNFIRASRTGSEGGSERPAEDEEETIDGNALHLLCAYRPPCDVVQLILRQHPEYASEYDSYRRTPLTVAVDYGASPKVVSALLTECPSLSETKDALGKTPLIHACENATGSTRSNGVIKALVSADPYSILEEDDMERTALEHAINAGAPDKVVRALQGTAIKVARDVKRRGGLGEAKRAMREKRDQKRNEEEEAEGLRKPSSVQKTQQQAQTLAALLNETPSRPPLTQSGRLVARDGMMKEKREQKQRLIEEETHEAPKKPTTGVQKMQQQQQQLQPSPAAFEKAPIRPPLTRSERLMTRSGMMMESTQGAAIGGGMRPATLAKRSATHPGGWKGPAAATSA